MHVSCKIFFGAGGRIDDPNVTLLLGACFMQDFFRASGGGGDR